MEIKIVKKLFQFIYTKRSSRILEYVSTTVYHINNRFGENKKHILVLNHKKIVQQNFPVIQYLTQDLIRNVIPCISSPLDCSELCKQYDKLSGDLETVDGGILWCGPVCDFLATIRSVPSAERNFRLFRTGLDILESVPFCVIPSLSEGKSRPRTSSSSLLLGSPGLLECRLVA